MVSQKSKNIPFSPPDISNIEINEIIDTLKFRLNYNWPKNKII